MENKCIRDVLACIVVHGHLLTKSHGVVGYGVAETVAVATNSLFHATFYETRIERAGIV